MFSFQSFLEVNKKHISWVSPRHPATVTTRMFASTHEIHRWKLRKPHQYLSWRNWKISTLQSSKRGASPTKNGTRMNSKYGRLWINIEKIRIHPRKLTWNTQRDGLEKVDSFKIWNEAMFGIRESRLRGLTSVGSRTSWRFEAESGGSKAGTFPLKHTTYHDAEAHGKRLRMWT